ncbi:MAG: GyrI-like domain-containing protein [Opitutales bacterium]
MDLELKTYPEQRFAYREVRTTLAKLQDAVQANMGDVLALAEAITDPRPPTFFYRDMTSMESEFTLQLAFPIHDSERSKVTTALRVKQTLPHACVCATYTGPHSGLMPAWMQFYGACQSAGYLTANEGREVYQVFAGDPNSADNVTELQLAVLGKTEDAEL